MVAVGWEAVVREAVGWAVVVMVMGVREVVETPVLAILTATCLWPDSSCKAMQHTTAHHSTPQGLGMRVPANAMTAWHGGPGRWAAGWVNVGQRHGDARGAGGSAACMHACLHPPCMTPMPSPCIGPCAAMRANAKAQLTSIPRCSSTQHACMHARGAGH